MQTNITYTIYNKAMRVTTEHDCIIYGKHIKSFGRARQAVIEQRARMDYKRVPASQIEIIRLEIDI